MPETTTAPERYRGEPLRPKRGETFEDFFYRMRDRCECPDGVEDGNCRFCCALEPYRTT